MNIDQQEFDRIATEIGDDSSPVGIDAKKTHILILHRLNRIQEHLDRLEQRMEKALDRQP